MFHNPRVIKNELQRTSLPIDSTGVDPDQLLGFKENEMNFKYTFVVSQGDQNNTFIKYLHQLVI